MRMRCVDPSMLCRNHLLGEHVETHMFAGTIKKGISVKGYISRGLLNSKLKERHDLLAEEMCKRGMCHNSSLDFDICFECEDLINPITNEEELKRRCPHCSELIDKRRGEKI